MRLIPGILFMTIILLGAGCSGNAGTGAGHWFHILFIIIPAGIFLYLTNRKIDVLSDSISKMDDKLSTMSSRLEKENIPKK